MKPTEQALEIIASHILFVNASDNVVKPNYTKRHFINALIVFQNALMDKMYDLQNSEKMKPEDRINMAENCGAELRKLIHTYTGIDTHDIENLT